MQNFTSEQISKFLALTVGPNSNYISINDLNNINLEDNSNKDLDFFKKEILNIFNLEIDSYSIIDGENIGVLLSGGLDSTLLLHLLKEKFPRSEIYTYTLGYNSNDGHLSVAKDISKTYGTIHKEVIHNLDSSLFNTFDDMYSSGYELEGEDSLIMNHILAKEVKKDCKIVFSGFGLDYLFGGMDLFRNSFMEKNYNKGLINKAFILKKLGGNKFYLKYILDKISAQSEDFFIKYGEYYGGALKEELELGVKKYFMESMENIRLDISDLKKQIFFIISTSLANRYRPYNVPYEKQGLKHFNPFGSLNTIRKIISLNIDDNFLLNPYTLEKKYIIRDIFRDLTGKDLINNLHIGTVLKYDKSIDTNRNELLSLISKNKNFLLQYLSEDYYNVIDRVIKDSVWYENTKQIIIILQLLYYYKNNNSNFKEVNSNLEESLISV